MGYVKFTCLLILLIIRCVESQDNNPYQQTANDEEEENNFEVLDLSHSGQHTSDLIDHELQPYQPLPVQQPQPQYYETYQPYQIQTQPEHYGQYQPYEPQIQTHQQYYQQQYGIYQSTEFQPTQQKQYYGPPEPQYPISYSDYTYAPPQIQPHGAPIQQEQYYVPSTTQTLTEPEPVQYYVPPPIQQQPTYPRPPFGIHQQMPPYQYYGPPHLTIPYDQYQPTYPQPPQTQPYEHYVQTQPQTLEEDENFYVTEHDQAHQVPSAGDTEFTHGPSQPTPIPPTQYIPPTQEQVAQEPIQPQKKPAKRPQTPSGYDDDEEQKPSKRKKPRPVKKSKHIKFFKRDSDGKLVEMIHQDYVVNHVDGDKTKYKFSANLERIESDGEIIYNHQSGTPYNTLLTQSRRSRICIMTNSKGFVLVKKIRGVWMTIEEAIPDDIKLFTKNEEDKLICLTEEHYDITFTSNGSFRYAINPGVNCHKIVVQWIMAWEKTENDDGFPELIYVTPKLTVIVKFRKYVKMYGRRNFSYNMISYKENFRRPKYD